MSQAQILHPSALSQEDLAAWRAMQARTDAFSSPLLGPDFAKAVGQVRDDARVAVWRRGGEAIGFLPHHRRPTGFGRPIGAPFCDYHALVSTPDFDVPAAEALASARLTALRLQGLVDPFGIFQGPVDGSEPAYRITLAGPSAQYLQGLQAQSANRAKNFRRYHRKLQADLGAVTLTAPDRDADAFAQLLAWKRLQLSRTGMHDFLQPQWTRTLLDSLFHRTDGAFQGLMISLYAGGRQVAGHFGVRLNGVFHPWISAMDPALDAYSPGFVHQWMAIDAMTGLGLHTYDLGTGSDHWKKLFTTDAVEIGHGLATADGLGGRLAGVSESLWAAPPLAGLQIANRMRNRLDQIATMELTVGGRVRGVITAVAALERRNAGRRPAPSTP
jgi:CelD/BcsL family acetyltransferase involved in cellulose biosynthesis